MIHGGDVYNNKVKIDFSVNVNPLKTPKRVIESINSSIDNLDAYPDYEAKALREKLSDVIGIKSEYIVCGSGASELLMAVVHAIKPVKALVSVPSFYGYKHVLDAVSAEVIYYYLKEEKAFMLDDGILDLIDREACLDMIILTNPNNPVGNYIDNNLFDGLLAKCKEKNITVLLDECFMELSEDRNNSRLGIINDYDNLLILRAFTKTFAMPALRLGYLVGSNMEHLSEIRKQLPEWNVSLLAQNAGVAALEEVNYLEASKAMINTERKYLSVELTELGIKVYPSVTDFVLIYSDILLYEKLLERGILIRDCSNFEGLSKGYYRIAIKRHKDNVTLVQALKEIFAV